MVFEVYSIEEQVIKIARAIEELTVKIQEQDVKINHKLGLVTGPANNATHLNQNTSQDNFKNYSKGKDSSEEIKVSSNRFIPYKSTEKPHNRDDEQISNVLLLYTQDHIQNELS